MQLFTIGLWQLNADGTRRRDANGNFIPTYTQDDVSGLARVFTGWSWGGAGSLTTRWGGGFAENWREQMQNYPELPFAQREALSGGDNSANTSGETACALRWTRCSITPTWVPSSVDS
jgi:hypothetical protein